MKKIFTLISVALVAMSGYAQEVWKAADYDLSNATIETLTANIYGAGTADAPDVTVPGTLKTSMIKASTDNITLTAVSTPNGDKTINTGADAWQLKGSETGNDALIVDGCNPQFAKYLMGQGNPEATHWEFDEETDNGTAHRVYGTYWEPGNDMPAKGLYLRFDAKNAGSLKVAIYGNKNGNPTYIVDASTKQPLAPSTVDVAIFYQNTGFSYDGGEHFLNVGKQADDYVLQHTNGITQNRPVLGYVTFPVEAGKSYYMFNTKSQIGLYGFEFTPGSNGIAAIATDAAAKKGVRYNMAGQQVDASYKGLVIENGKKFVVK